MTIMTLTRTRLHAAWPLVALLTVSLPPGSPASPEAEDVALHRNLGKAYYEQGQYALAVEELVKVVASERAGARDYLNLGMVYLQNGEMDRALGAFTTARQMDPVLIEVDFGLALLYKREGRYPPALEAFGRVAARDPDDPCTWLNIGIVSFSMQRFDEAEEAFRKVLDMGYPAARNFYVSALFREATLLARAGKGQEARRFFEEFKRLRDKTPNVALTPTALENGKYGQIVVPIGLKERPVKALAAAPPLVSVSETAFAESPCGEEPALALGDFDKDGRVDVFVGSPCGADRLFRNEGGVRFADVTSEAGLKGSRQSRFAAFADLDNSGYPSLLALGNDGTRLYSNREGRFQNVTPASGLAAAAHGVSTMALVFDFDNDGQLDIFLGGPRGLALYRNNGDGTFRDVSRDRGLELEPDAGLRGGAAADFNEDGFIDVLLVLRGNQARVLSNPGRGAFVSQALPLSSGPLGVKAARVEVEDFDHDGWLDVLVLDEKGYSILLNREGALDPVSALPPLRPHPGRLAAALDADGDGFVDLLAGDGPSALRLLRNEGRGRFQLLPLDAGEVQGATGPSVAADLDGAGTTDVVVATREGKLRVFRVQPSLRPHWLRIALEGKKTNRDGRGALVEVKAGRFYQKHLARGLPFTLYLGERTSVDVVRVTWANGVVQNEVQVNADHLLPIVEEERQTSSCPFLYVWDGERFRFLTDVVGRAPLGEIEPDGSLTTPYPEDFVRIPPELLKARGGRYELQVTEELRELAYLDGLELLAVDHAEDTDVYTNERFSAPPVDPFRLYEVTQPWSPLSAIDERGRDVLAEVAQRDGRYVGGFSLHRISGFAEEHALILDPGPSAAHGHLRLFLTGWVYWPSSSSMKAVATHASFAPEPPRLEVKNDEGRWVTVIEELGLPSGTDRTLTVDLTGKSLSADRSLRIVTNFRVYWDQAFFARAPRHRTARVHRRAPLAADLHYRGFSTLLREDAGYRPERFDYDTLLAVPPWNAALGRFTRYGDVLELLSQADDRLVLMAPGDEVTVSFDAQSLPSVPPGMRRDFFVHVTGWAKDNDPNTLFSSTVEPLPYRGMKDYAAAAEGQRRQSTSWRAYLDRYQTRRVPALLPPLVTTARPKSP